MSLTTSSTVFLTAGYDGDTVREFVESSCRRRSGRANCVLKALGNTDRAVTVVKYCLDGLVNLDSNQRREKLIGFIRPCLLGLTPSGL